MLSRSANLNDVEIAKDNTLEVGGRLLNVPRVNGSVLAVYEGALPSGQRYGVGGGVEVPTGSSVLLPPLQPAMARLKATARLKACWRPIARPLPR